MAGLVAVPPGVVTAIFPDFAPVGTVTVICVPEFTVKLVAALPPKVTFVVCNKPVPVMVTTVPTGPCRGVNESTTGFSLNGWLLVRLPLGMLTTTEPKLPPAGTVTVM